MEDESGEKESFLNKLIILNYKNLFRDIWYQLSLNQPVLAAFSLASMSRHSRPGEKIL